VLQWVLSDSGCQAGSSLNQYDARAHYLGSEQYGLYFAGPSITQPDAISNGGDFTADALSG
jgi:hypothetical protein